MSETPETDNQQLVHSVSGAPLRCVDVEFARKLERERNSLQEQRDFCMGEIERLKKEAAHKDKLLREMRAAIRMVSDDSCRGWLL